jgi:hypothetical protein
VTVLVGSVATILILLSAGFLRDLHAATIARLRAQTAADAAALAAASEAAPYGVGAPGALAREYAEANGGRMLSCDCALGAAMAQVTVSFNGVIARARAEYDPRRLRPRAVAGTEGLHPRLASAVQRLLQEAGGAVRIVSGFRSLERQTELWRQALIKYGSPEAADDWVAPPGRSMHERGLAVDLGGDLELAGRLVAELGLSLHRPLPHEPWHFELSGTR